MEPVTPYPRHVSIVGLGRVRRDPACTLRPVRLRTASLGLAVVLLLGVLVAGCGDEGRSSSPLDAALRYLPTGAGAVLVIDTDVDGSQLRTFDRKLAPRLFGDGLGNVLRRTVAGYTELSFDRDVKRQLGNPLVVSFEPTRVVAGGFSRAQPLAAIQLNDGERVRSSLRRDGAVRAAGQVFGTDVFRRRDGWMLTVDGDMLVVARSRARLARALAQRDEQDRLTERRFDRALTGLPRTALVRGYGGLQPLLGRPELERLQDVNWVASLQSFALAASFDRSDRLSVQVGLNTDPNEVKTSDLPVSGAGSPPLTKRRGEVAEANADPGQSIHFALASIRTLFPHSRFVRDLAAVEDRRRIDVEHDLLDAFEGPSATSFAPGEGFATRIKVSDPARTAVVLRRIAPSLGRLNADLGRLRAQARGVVALAAPSTRLAQGVLGGGRVKVRRLRGERSLYRLSRSRSRRGRRPIYFGVVGDYLVAASDPADARAITEAPVEPAGGPAGSVTLRADGRELRRPFARAFGLEGAPLGRIVGSLAGARSGVRATLRVELP